MKKKRKILFAYEAFHFIRNHPAFKKNERTLITKNHNKNDPRIIEEDGVKYIEHKHVFKHALDEILSSMWYTHVDNTGTVNSNSTKNKFVECWLEGILCEYTSVQKKRDNEFRKKEAEENRWEPFIEEIYSDDYVTFSHIHDWKLDDGAATFDEAIVKLANNILKNPEYGDYKDGDESGYKSCGGVATCIDCLHSSQWMGKNNIS